MAEGAALVWCPFPDLASAREIARVVIAERLAACANMVPGIESLFVWQGEIQSAAEAGTLFKTDARLLPRLIDRLAELHPYETPAIVGWRCDQAAPATLAWLGALIAEG